MLNKILIAFASAALTVSAATNTDMLVDTAWLADHLNDSNLVVVHMGANASGYEAGHIPGARFVALGDITVSRDGIPNELPPAADLKAAFEAAGISDTTRVILYAEGSVLPATRAYFTLDYLGHGDQTALLDGGLDKWKAENRALSTEAPDVTAGNLTVRTKAETVVSTAAVKDMSFSASLESANAAADRIPTLLDVRSSDLFTGNSDRAGHIPGAVNIDWTENQMTGGSSLQSEDSLRALYEAAGIQPGSTVIAYCNSGMQATQSYFTLKYLGYDVRLYDGSMSEWTAAGDTTVAK